MALGASPALLLGEDLISEPFRTAKVPLLFCPIVSWICVPYQTVSALRADFR